jgi:hypothetical protein
MGRPIKRNFFKNPGNAPVPGDSISSVNITNRGLGYFSANVAMTLSAPDLAEGTQATVSSVSLFSNGAIRSATIDNAGAGYVNAPTVTITGANTNPATATTSIALTSGSTGAKIAMSAWIPAGRFRQLMALVLSAWLQPLQLWVKPPSQPQTPMATPTMWSSSLVVVHIWYNTHKTAVPIGCMPQILKQQMY